MQLFDKVSVTKPEASRNNSTEAYAICKGFTGSKDVHENFFNPESIFSTEKEKPVLTSVKEIFKKNSQNKLNLKLSHIPSQCSVKDFLISDNYLDILAGSYKVFLFFPTDVDDSKFLNIFGLEVQIKFSLAQQILQ